MNPPAASPDSTGIREAAAHWTVRRDRGLSSAEAIEFELWLAADPRHAVAMRRAAGMWSLLERVPSANAQHHLATANRRRLWRRRGLVVGSLAAAAVLLLAIWAPQQTSSRDTAPATSLVATGLRSVTLADGSLVRLNDGSEIVEEFTPAERRVRLTRGEAHFTVTHNPARPFIVSAGALRVQAVGTAFDVNLQSARTEVLVTEGRVQLTSTTPAAAPLPLIVAGERARMESGSSASTAAGQGIVVTKLDPSALAAALAWQEPLLRLGGATLAEIAAEFERRSGQRVVLADPALAQLRVGGRFRADDAAGFAHLMASAFDIDVEHAGDGTIVLQKKKRDSR